MMIQKIGGERITAYFDMCLARHDSYYEGMIFAEEKTKKVLKGAFFNGIKEEHKVNGENKVYTISPLFDRYVISEFIKLNPDNIQALDKLDHLDGGKKREAIFKLDDRVRIKYNQARTAMASGVCEMVLRNNHKIEQYHRTCLTNLGYGEGEQARILSLLIDDK